MKKIRLSHTGLQTYTDCNRMYKYRYVDRISQKAALPLVTGNIFHEVVEKNLLQKIKTGVDLPIDDLVFYYTGRFQKWFTKLGFLFAQNGTTRENELLLGEELIRAQHETFAPKIKPIAVEYNFNIEMQNCTFNGKIDIIDNPKEDIYYIRDNKTFGKPKTAGEFNNDKQLVRYAMAFRHDFAPKEETGVCWDIIVKRNEKKGIPKTKTQALVRAVSLEECHYAWEEIEDIAAQILEARRTGDFPANPRYRWCQFTYRDGTIKPNCPYWNMCQKPLQEEKHEKILDKL